MRTQSQMFSTLYYNSFIICEHPYVQMLFIWSLHWFSIDYWLYYHTYKTIVWYFEPFQVTLIYYYPLLTHFESPVIILCCFSDEPCHKVFNSQCYIYIIFVWSDWIIGNRYSLKLILRLFFRINNILSLRWGTSRT